ncbi:MAG: hypothetical protein Q8R44_19915 [Novosphingobium sp.]|nr:hypothetical protein [Novosphingobium sp.]
MGAEVVADLRTLSDAAFAEVRDNRAALHIAANDYDGYRRETYRTTLAGDVPV